MRVIETTKDFMLMPKGSVCEIKNELKDFYRVIWGSMGGTYEVLIPKNICKPYKNRLDDLFKDAEFKKIVKKLYGNNRNR